jgi:hypothetical protein
MNEKSVCDTCLRRSPDEDGWIECQHTQPAPYDSCPGYAYDEVRDKLYNLAARLDAKNTP